jgi:predicted unusual protein kinase regulating ubiquinone biosynthesis (AarF/ABC1/UbiB family)
MVPFAAASIGQVHSAILSPTSPLARIYSPSMRLAVKVQFPGVRVSISSDLNNLKWLLIAGSILPRGLYLENTIRVMERELDEECDYLREAECGVKMRELVEKDDLADDFAVPRVLKELCGPMVLTTELMSGNPLGEAITYDQATRDRVRVPLTRLAPSLTRVFADRREHLEALSAGALPLPLHANRPKLEQLSLQPSNSTREPSFLRRPLRSADLASCSCGRSS